MHLRVEEQEAGGGLPGTTVALANEAEGFGLPDLFNNSGSDWQNIFDTLTDMITIHDRDFNIIEANRAARTVLGIQPSKTGGAKCFKFYHGSDSPPEGCPSCNCLQTRKPALFETYERHLKLFLEIRSIPRFDDGGRFIGLIHIARDITRRKLAEGELDVHRKHLEWLVKERTAELSRSVELLLFEIGERERAEKERESLIAELQDAVANVKTLKGLLPICAWCNKIRDDSGSWKRVETYIKEHSDASFTHHMCPDCLKKESPETHEELFGTGGGRESGNRR
jgi:PAS domain S-box-containing protein